MADIADIVIRVDSTQLVNATTATQNLRQNTLNLLSSLSRVGAANLAYRREVQTLNQAQQQGIITNSELSRSLRQLESRYNSMGLALDSTGNLIESSQGQANKFGHTVQQVGYQVGDFFVQIQSGTDALVAFGQQGTQLAGLIPGVFGAALGIGISLVTALGATFLKTANSSRTFQDSLDQVKESLADTGDIVKVVNGDFEQLIEKFGGVSQAILNLSQAKAEVSLRKMSDAAKALRDELSDMYSGSNWTNQSRVEDLASAFDFTSQQTRQLAFALEDLGGQDTLQGQVEAATRLRELFVSMAGPVESMTEDEFKFYLSMVDAEEAARELFRRTAEVEGKTGNLITLMTSFVDAANGAAIAVNNIKTASEGALGVVAQLATKMWEAAQARLAANRALDSMKMEFSPAGQAMAAYGSRGTVSDTPVLDQFGKPIPIVKPNRPKPRPTDIDFGYNPDDTAGGGSKRETQLRKEISLVKELTQAEKDRQTIVQSVQSSLEEGFMAMVDGTSSVKDAFKSMARDIIKELYRVLVVQRMVGGISSAFGPLTGPSTGSFGLPFGGKNASGGSMIPGKSYLVGEHGPELVVPRHSGTVMNANQTANALGGGSGNVTVQNNITVTGSDAAMVRAEVAKMIPQITNATKAAVIDAKQRGGQMAAAFR